MAKKTKTEAPATPENDNENAPAAPAAGIGAIAAQRAQVAEGDRFVAVPIDGNWDGDKTKFVDPAKKVAPQAQIIINRIRAAGEAGITRKELVSALVPAGLVTRQPAGRILSYYQKEICASGAVKLTKAS